MAKIKAKITRSKWKQTLLAVFALVFVAGLITGLSKINNRTKPSHAAHVYELPQNPLRVAFYYPWFFSDTTDPNQGLTWGHWSPWVPTLSKNLGHSYISTDAATYTQHISDLIWGKYDAAAFAWAGRTDSKTNGNFDWSSTYCKDNPGSGNGNLTTNKYVCLFGNVLDATTGKPLKWAMLDEHENFSTMTQAQTEADLTYFKDHYFNHPSYLKVNGKPVVFAFISPPSGQDQCDVVRRWRLAQANTHIDVYFDVKTDNTKTGRAWDACPDIDQPEAWFNWMGSVSSSGGQTLNNSINPAFWDPIDTEFNNDRDLTDNQYTTYRPRIPDASNPKGWPNVVKAQANSGVKWQLTETFNDWGEGTSVESAAYCNARNVTSNPTMPYTVPGSSPPRIIDDPGNPNGMKLESSQRCQSGWETSSGHGYYLDVLRNNPISGGGGGDPPVVSLSADDTTITSGSNVTMTWNVSGATSCTATGGATGWSGSKAAGDGSHTQTITQTNTKTYGLSCANANGNTDANDVTVTVGQAPTVNIGANPSSVTSGGSTILTWSTTNADACTASGDWSGSKNNVGGTQTITNVTVNKTFNISCSNSFADSPATDTVAVTVTANPIPRITLNVNPASIKPPEQATISWTTTNATSCTANGSWTGAQPTSGALSVNPITNGLYRLACTGPGGTNSAVVGLTVTPSNIPGDIANAPNGDGKVNIDDFAYLVSNWNTTDPRANLDGTGVVDFGDLSKWSVYNQQCHCGV